MTKPEKETGERSHNSDEKPQGSYEWFWEGLSSHLRSHGLKVTKQRNLIVEHFLKMGRHVDAEDLYNSVNKVAPSVGLATIYRTLNLLTEAGLAEQSVFGADNKAVFEIRQPGDHHDHLICKDCGKIFEFENDEIEQLQIKIAESMGFQLVDHRLDLFGKCRQAGCKNLDPKGSS